MKEELIEEFDKMFNFIDFLKAYCVLEYSCGIFKFTKEKIPNEPFVIIRLRGDGLVIFKAKAYHAFDKIFPNSMPLEIIRFKDWENVLVSERQLKKKLIKLLIQNL